MNHFVKCFQKLRKNQGTTYQSMADALHISLRALKYYGTGEREPSLSVLTALADYFDVPLDYLTGRGLFENWEEIMEHKLSVLISISMHMPIVNSLDLQQRSEKELMRILPAFIKKIEFDDSGNPNIVFYA